MKKLFFLLAFCALLAAEGSSITVFRKGREVWIRSRYSKTQDIIINVFGDINERSYLVPRNSDIHAWKKVAPHHNSGDEYPSSHFGHYGYIGGNHGSAYGSRITCKDHPFTMADSGKILTDSGKYSYVFVKVVDKDNFVIHPVNRNKKAPIGQADFVRYSIKRKLFYNGKALNVSAVRLAQVRPMNIIDRNEFLVDGKTPLVEGKVVKCRFLDHVFEHGVLAPEAIVEYIRKEASAKTASMITVKQFKMFYPEENKEHASYAKLPRLMTVKNRMRYQQNGAMVNYRSVHYPVTTAYIRQLDVMFGEGGSMFRNNKYDYFYIPKSKPLEIPRYKDNKAPKYKCDFAQGYKLPAKFMVNYNLTPEHALDPCNLPDRFIRVTGKKDKPEHGIVLGYSLLDGITALSNKGKDRPIYYYLWFTKKMYPHIYVLKNNQPDLTVRSVSYKQYFAPSNDPDAVAFYYHKQHESTLVYFETRKTLKNKTLALPPCMKGKKITVVEKSKSVTLHTPGNVPASGVKISSSGNNGYIVLKLD